MTKQRTHLQSTSTGPSFATAPIARAIRAQWRRQRLLVPALIAGTIAAAPAHAATINVTANAVDQDDNNNCSIVEAFLSAEDDSSFDNCTSGAGDDVIVLPANSTFSFDGVTSFENWSGNSALPEVTTKIVVTGNNSRLTATGGENFRLVGVGVDGDLTLGSVNIDGGSGEEGGNVQVYDGALALVDSIVSDNASMNLEGPPFPVPVSPTLVGGGIAVLGGIIGNTPTLSLVNSVVSGNVAMKYGGGIHNDGGVVTLQNSEVSDNVAYKYGGGISNESGTMTLTDSRIFGNRAKYAGDGDAAGGGIANGSDGTLTLVSSTVSGNSAGLVVPGPPEQTYGGGIANYGSASLINSTISGNDAKYGGGIAHGGAGFMELINTTVAANDAGAIGGGIVNRSDLFLTNSIVTANTADEDFDNCFDEDATDKSGRKSARGGRFAKGVLPKVRVTPKAVSGFYSLSADPGNCNGFTVSASINLDILADNGGPTETHALLTGSSAIDTGFVPACDKFGIANDQRGFPRDALCDVGAFEFGAEPAEGPGRRGVSIGFNDNLVFENGGPGTFRVRVPDPLPNDVVVGLRYEGDATLGLDFQGPDSLTIEAGKESAVGVIVAINDTLDEEPLERIRMVITSVQGSTGEGRKGIAAIVDDDATPPATVPGQSLTLPTATLALSPASLAEAGGTGILTATLSEAARWPVAVTLGFAGSATSAADYTPSTSQIVIPAGETTGSATLTAIDDAVDEANETVTITATAWGAALGASSLTATVLDDDTTQGGPPGVPDGSIGPVTSVIGGNLVDLVVGAALRDARVMPGDSNVPAAGGTISNPGATAITVNRVHATLAAFGASLADVTGARLYLDSDGDGMLELTDPLLAQTSVIGQGGALAFDLAGLTLNPGQSVRVLVALDFANQFALGKSLMLAGTGMGLPLLGLAGWRRRRSHPTKSTATSWGPRAWLVPVTIAAGLGVSACSDDGATPVPQSQQRVYQLTLDQVEATGGAAALSDTVSVVLTSPR